MGHQIYRIFFYYEGVYNGLRWMAPPVEEAPLLRRWSTLATEQGVDLVICISAAQRRGLLEQTGSKREDKLDDGLALGFRIAGLGMWVDACLKADRFLVFGA